MVRVARSSIDLRALGSLELGERRESGRSLRSGRKPHEPGVLAAEEVRVPGNRVAAAHRAHSADFGFPNGGAAHAAVDLLRLLQDALLAGVLVEQRVQLPCDSS